MSEGISPTASEPRHVRTKIRTAVESALAAIPSAPAIERMSPHPPSRFPALRVTAGGERVDRDAMGVMGAVARTGQLRELVIEIALFVRPIADDPDPQDALDALALEVERAMHADPTWGGLALLTDYAATRPDVGREGGQRTGVLILDYLIKYRTLEGVPETAR